jgi:hypothetical protein
MSNRIVAAPVLDPRIYPAPAVLPLINAAIEADPRLQVRQTEAGLHLNIVARERTEGEQCLSKLLTRLTLAAMEDLLPRERSLPAVPSSCR